MATALTGERVKLYAPRRAGTGVLGICVGGASILMMFTALASAYVVRAGLPTSTDWRPIALRPVLIVGTALIVASSLPMALAQASARRGDARALRNRLALTLLLGAGFIAAQLLAWRQLAAEGVYLATNPHSSFFYLLTGLHALHLAGGILFLGRLLWGAALAPTNETARRRAGSRADAVGLYWHFMGALWVSLFLLLFFWR